MHYQSSGFDTTPAKLDKVMEADQFAQVVEAILAGKYSWACVLILRFAGYNPLHYIPYRTYNRLIKDNIQSASKGKAFHRVQNVQHEVRPAPDQKSLAGSTCKSLYPIKDLAYLEVVQEEHQVGGGQRFIWVNNWLVS